MLRNLIFSCMLIVIDFDPLFYQDPTHKLGETKNNIYTPSQQEA